MRYTILFHILLIILLLQMIEHKSGMNSTLRLQHMIHEYKKQQADKSQLENKLIIIQQKCDANHKKAKIFRNQLSKINTIKVNYQSEKAHIQEQLIRETQRQARKIVKGKTLREKSKENMHIIRNMIQREKTEDYNRIKERTKYNEMRITQNFKQSLHLKRQKSLEVKLQEEGSKLSRTIYMEKKRMIAQNRSELQLKPLEMCTSQTKEQIKLMKQLEKEMTEQLRTSRQSLSNSKLRYSRSMR